MKSAMSFFKSWSHKITSLLLITTILSSQHISSTALSCSDVYNDLLPCLSYFQGEGGRPASECCDGIKAVLSMAHTAADRRSACTCLKTVASGVSEPNLKLAGGLPSACGVSVPFIISPKTNCNKVK